MALGSLQDREINKFSEIGDKVVVNVTSPEDGQTMAFDQASSTVMYLGYAVAGSLTSAAVWKIKKFEISGTVIISSLADSNDLYDNVWDNRGSLTYG